MTNVTSTVTKVKIGDEIPTQRSSALINLKFIG
jgi:hypothetical protein